MPEKAPASPLHLPLARLPQEADERAEVLRQYFCELKVTARRRNNEWRLSFRRPPTRDFYVDPDLYRGLQWWRKNVGPLRTTQIADAVVRRGGYVLSMSDAWTLHSWSEWLSSADADLQAVTILHLDDHRDFMSPRLERDATGFLDMLTGSSVDLLKPKTVAAAIRSGAVGMGSFVAPFLHHLNGSDVRQLTSRQRIWTDGIKALALGFSPDTLLKPTAERPTVTIAPTNRTPTHWHYQSTASHTDWLAGIAEGPILLHIDMDYFSNRYDCDSDRIGGELWYDPNPDWIRGEIDHVFASLEACQLPKRIVSCHIALSPGFFTGDLWDCAISQIEQNIQRLHELHEWGPWIWKSRSAMKHQAMNGVAGNHSVKSKAVVSLLEGKGSRTRGFGPGGRYWHVLADVKRIGCVFINVAPSKSGNRPSLQIFLSAHSRGKGYGREAYRLACEASGFPEIYIEMRKSNLASRRAALAAGFIIDKTARGHQLAMVWRRSGAA